MTGQEYRLPADNLPFPHMKDGYGRLFETAGHGHYVTIEVFGGVKFLFLGQALDGAHLVPQGGGSLIIRFGGFLLHLLHERFHQGPVLPLKQKFNFFDQLPIVSFTDLATAHP